MGLSDIAQAVVVDFGASLAHTLPGDLRMWAGGLTMYILVASALAIVALRKSRSLSAKTLWAHVFPRHLYANFSARITLWHFVIQIWIWAPLFGLMTFAPTLAAAGIATSFENTFGKGQTTIHSAWIVILVQTSVIALAMSFASYLHHYAFHRIPILWSFHRSHHSVEALTLPATARHHPLDLFTIQIFMNTFAAVFGGATLYVTGMQLHPSTFVLIGGWALAYFVLSAIFNHSHIPISFGWFNRILMAPIIHQFHHSAETRHRDRNIGSFLGLMIWDWMFGTLYLPKKDEPYRWGLNEDQLGNANPHQRLRDLYIEPFQHAWKLAHQTGLKSIRPAARLHATSRNA